MIYSVKPFFCLRDVAFATLLSLCPRHNGFNVFPVRDVIGFLNHIRHHLLFLCFIFLRLQCTDKQLHHTF